MPAKISVIIPARYGSTRFPGKPLHLIAGKPLIQHVWERSQKARGIDEVVIATDDMRIAEAAFAFGADVALTSEKHRSGTDRVAEVAKRMRSVTHIINVQGDEPLIDPALLARLAKALMADKHVEMITAASEFDPDEDVTNPNAVKVVCDRKGNALYFSRAAIPFVRAAAGNVQLSTSNIQRPTAGDSPLRGGGARDKRGQEDGRANAQYSTRFLRHHGIYGYTRKFLLQFVTWKPGQLEQLEQLEQLRALENGAAIRVLMTRSKSIGVDAPEDVAAIERMLFSSSS